MKYKDNLVSVVLPVFNSEKYLNATINSVLSQSYSELELIIVDDSSVDSSYEICKSFLKDSRVKLYRNSENLGSGITRNNCLRHAQGRFISFIDADDLWHECKLQNQVSFIISNNSPICHTSYTFINESGSDIPGFVRVSPLLNLIDYMKNTEIGMSSAMIDRSIVGDISFDCARTRQDTLLWLGLLDQGFYSVGLDENLVKYRIRTGQISGNKFKMLYRTFHVYMTVKSLSRLKIFIFYLNYIFNAILKRF